MSTIEQITHLREARQQAAIARVDALARLEADGKPVSAVEVADVIDAAGLTDTWFGERVQHYRTRANLLAKVSMQAQHEQRRGEAQKAIDSAMAEYKTAEAKFNAAYGPLTMDLREAMAGLSEAGRAAADLRRGCKDPTITGRLTAIGSELMALQEQRGTLQKRLTYLEAEIPRVQADIAYQLDRKAHPPKDGRDPRLSVIPGVDYDEAEHNRLTVALATYEGELTQVQSTLESLPAAIAALQAERLTLEAKAEQSPL